MDDKYYMCELIPCKKYNEYNAWNDLEKNYLHSKSCGTCYRNKLISRSIIKQNLLQEITKIEEELKQKK
jgi:hypothetical protein